MANVEFDPLDAPPILNLGPGGYTGTRFADAVELQGTPVGGKRPRITTDARVLNRAIADVQNAGARPGVDVWPSLPQLPVHDLSAVMRDGQQTMARVTINYRVPDVGNEAVDPDPNAPPQLEIGATVQQRQTTRYGLGAGTALAGTQILVPRQSPEGEDLTPQPGTVTETFAASKLIYRRRMGPNLGIVIRDLAAKYVGTVNSKAFGEAAATAPAGFRQWMCTGITGTSTDGGVYYDVTYEFQRLTDLEIGTNKLVGGYDPVAEWEEASGLPTSGMSKGNGIIRVLMPEGVEWAELGLPT